MTVLTLKKSTNNQPIAKIKGGYYNGKTLYIKDCDRERVDINGNQMILNEILRNKRSVLKQGDYDRINSKIQKNFYNLLKEENSSDEEEEDYEEEDYRNDKNLGQIEKEILELYKKEKAKRLYLTTGCLIPIPELSTQQTDSILITGPRGSGKSYFCAQYMKNYHKYFPKNNIIIITSKGERDNNFSDIKGLMRYEVTNELANEPIDLDLFRDSLTVFDDYENFPKTKRKGELSQQDFVNELRDKILMEGRTRNISIVMINHIAFNNSQTRCPLSESSKIVLMSSCNTYIRERMLKTYLGYRKQEMDKIKSLKGRWVMFSKTPNFAMSEYGCIVF